MTALTALCLSQLLTKELKAQNNEYINNRSPLKANPYIELPLGAIKPAGWLKEQLIRQKDGMTGQLDKLYPEVMGKRNGWLGGDGDVWERGPYWIDGLSPLAYILDDPGLKAKAQEWVEWSIKNQDTSGYFGPIPLAVDPPKEEGLQRDRSLDWWPKMVMLKVLKQYYNATKDQRAINLMSRYFKYQLKELPVKKLDNWSWWGAQRGGEYYQQPNQVMLTRQERNFYTNYQGTEQVLGLLTGFPCCTANMHQGWPKFTQNLWYTTADGGVAALLYAPSTVTLNVANKIPVTITEITNYPFTDKIVFSIKTAGTASFPFHLRIPKWCKEAEININGKIFKSIKGDTIAVVNRSWKNGDVVELKLPMNITRSKWHENSVVVERGPLVYSLKINEEWKKVEGKDKFGAYYEVRPLSLWNYGILNVNDSVLQTKFRVTIKSSLALYPWTVEDAPVEIHVPAKVLKDWQIYNGSAGPLPYSVQKHTENIPVQEVTLIPYGCTTLRITEFPEVK